MRERERAKEKYGWSNLPSAKSKGQEARGTQYTTRDTRIGARGKHLPIRDRATHAHNPEILKDRFSGRRWPSILPGLEEFRMILLRAEGQLSCAWCAGSTIVLNAQAPNGCSALLVSRASLRQYRTVRSCQLPKPSRSMHILGR